jgi:hypothetical protein
MRHTIKMAERRKQKAAKAALYASYANGDNSKRKTSKAIKPVTRTRDLKCKNIGDIVSYPDLVCNSLGRFMRGKNQYTGKYKHQMAYERMKIFNANGGNLNIDTWLDEPVKNELNHTITRRTFVIAR